MTPLTNETSLPLEAGYVYLSLARHLLSVYSSLRHEKAGEGDNRIDRAKTKKPRRNRSARSDDAGVHMAKVNEGDPATYDCLVRTTRDSNVEGRGQQLPSNYSNWRCAYGQAFRDEVRLRAGIHAIPVRPD